MVRDGYGVDDLYISLCCMFVECSVLYIQTFLSLTYFEASPTSTAAVPL
jgi:hypothetical protein